MLSLVLSAVVAFSMLIVSTGKAEAASGRYYYSPTIMYAGQDTDIGMYDTKADKDIKITSVKSANKGIVKVKKPYGYYRAVAVKPGKTKLTIKYKTVSGKNATTKKTVRVKAYPNPIKSLKVNGKSVSLTKDQRYLYEGYKYKKTKAPVAVSLNDGWKITTAYGFYYTKNYDMKEIKGVKKSLTGGKAISFPKKYKMIQITFTMSKGNDNIDYTVLLNR